MIFEDPDGTRILYDPGQTVAGAADPRLGKIDAVLLSHVHTDHLGDRHIKTVNAGTCAHPDTSVVDAPSSNTEKIRDRQEGEIPGRRRDEQLRSKL
jgi:L-ascorbate metabolism protein UlaG (beta-lactamase superfamily)